MEIKPWDSTYNYFLKKRYSLILESKSAVHIRAEVKNEKQVAASNLLPSDVDSAPSHHTRNGSEIQDSTRVLWIEHNQQSRKW